MKLDDKKVLLAAWGCENPKDIYMYQIYYLMLKFIFPKLDTFDTKKHYFQLGKEEMNSKFLDLVKSSSFDLIIFAFENDEFSLKTFKEIKKISNAKTLVIICDDDARFDSWSRYISLFFDFVITSQDYLKEYKKDGIKDVFFHLDYNTYKLEPMKLKTIYDVTFIGRPKADRNEVLKYLLDNGVNIALFGWDWHKYPEFKEVYKGPLSQEDYAKVINQSKINLSPAKAGYSEEKKHYNMKGRYFEVALCKSFQLIEKFPTLLKFFSQKEIGMYDSEEDMLKKVQYYLIHEKEREKIAESSYNIVIKKYNRKKQLLDIFSKVFRKSRKNIQSSEKKIITLIKQDLNADLTEKIKDFDYIAFSDESPKISEFKNQLQTLSLEKTKKEISCCDYYVSNFGLKDYALFTSKFAFKRIGNEANKLLDINQLMVAKEYFIANLDKFKKLFNSEPVDIVEEKNTAFISIPLVTISRLRKIDYELMKKAFEMKFPNELFSLIYKKRILTSSYPYKLSLKAFAGNWFIFSYLKELWQDRSNKDKLAVNQVYVENSALNKFKDK